MGILESRFSQLAVQRIAPGLLGEPVAVHVDGEPEVPCDSPAEAQAIVDGLRDGPHVQAEVVNIPQARPNGERLPNISLDFDGVIHSYTSPWTSATEIHDPPVPGAFEFIRNALTSGYGVHIHTARMNEPRAEQAIVAWLLKHGLEFHYIDRLIISAVKKSAVVYIDDRGMRFTGTFPSLEQIDNFKPWNRT